MREVEGLREIRHSLFVHFRLDERFPENGCEPNFSAEVVDFGRNLNRSPNVLSRSFEIAIVKRSYSNLSECSVLPALIAQLRSQSFNLLPIAPACPDINLLIDISLHDQAKHSKLFVRLEQGILFELAGEICRRTRQVALLDRRTQQA
jgi:hypothetical protein